MENQERSNEEARVIGRLLEAQEEERGRIARELHDEIGPALAIIGMDLLKTDQSGAGPSVEKHPDVQELYRKVQEIGSRISRLSHHLRPPMLKYFGLAKAIQSECREFSESSGIPASCSCGDIPNLDPAVALTLFRVVQEALCNAGKHSHATGITVNVAAASDALTLEISDDGAGFNVDQMDAAAGLGLVSMRGRMRLIGGEFEIGSHAGQGTKISCRAPLSPCR